MHMLPLGALPQRCAVTALHWLVSMQPKAVLIDYYGTMVLAWAESIIFQSLAGSFACPCPLLHDRPRQAVAVILTTGQVGSRLVVTPAAHFKQAREQCPAGAPDERCPSMSPDGADSYCEMA